MPSLPYLPGGVAELPAERFVLFADGSNVVMRMDESTLLKAGVSFTAHWETPTLNQVREGFEFTLNAIEIWYAAVVATSVRVLVSGDGAETFSTPQVVTLPITAGRVARRWATFENVPQATGDDIRVRFEMNQDDLSVIYGYRPHLVDRGDLIL